MSTKQQQQQQQPDIDTDEVLEEVGSQGFFQYKTVVLLWLATGSAGIAVVAFAFLALSMPHRCSVPECGEVPGVTPYRWDQGNEFSVSPDSNEFH